MILNIKTMAAFRYSLSVLKIYSAQSTCTIEKERFRKKSNLWISV